jgi:hypothetical protein
MEVLVQRSASSGTVNDLLASLALREPSICSTSAELELGIEVEDADELLDEEALSDQDRQQLEVRPRAAVARPRQPAAFPATPGCAILSQTRPDGRRIGRGLAAGRLPPLIREPPACLPPLPGNPANGGCPTAALSDMPGGAVQLAVEGAPGLL